MNKKVVTFLTNYNHSSSYHTQYTYNSGLTINLSDGPTGKCIMYGSNQGQIAYHHHFRYNLKLSYQLQHCSKGRKMLFFMVLVSGQHMSSLADRVDQSVSAPAQTLTAAFNDRCMCFLEASVKEGNIVVHLPVKILDKWHAIHNPDLFL